MERNQRRGRCNGMHLYDCKSLPELLSAQEIRTEGRLIASCELWDLLAVGSAAAGHLDILGPYLFVQPPSSFAARIGTVVDK